MSKHRKISDHLPFAKQMAQASVTHADIITAVAQRTFLQLPGNVLATQPSESIAWCIRQITEHYDEKLRLENLAGKAGLTKFQLARRFRKETGMNPGTFLQRYRMCIAMDQLIRSEALIQTIADNVGYGDASSFSRAFLRVIGTQPYLYRQTRSAE